MLNLLIAATDRLKEAGSYHPNSFGHDKKHPRIIAVTNPYKSGVKHDDFGHQRKGHSFYSIQEKIRNLATNPLAYPELGYTEVDYLVQKHGENKQQKRSDIREKISNVALYFSQFCEFISGKVGIRGYGNHGQFRCFDIDHAIEWTGMSRDAIKVAVKELDELGMIERQRIWVKKPDGSYGGRPSIYQLTAEFWSYFGATEEYESLRRFYYNKQLKKFCNDTFKVAAGLSCRVPDSIKKPIKKIFKPKRGNDSPDNYQEDDIRHYLARLPKEKHRAYHALVIDLYSDSGNGLTTGEQVYKAAYRAV